MVTGATGFAGKALVLRLLSDGFSVHALVRNPDRARELESRGASLFTGSIIDPNEIFRAAAGCELLFHCAGESSLRSAPRVYQWINVAGTENIIQAARQAGCKRVIHLSCADVSLINQDRIHWNENRVLTEQPLGQFARSRLLAEELALSSSRNSTEITAVRAAWTWGPGDLSMLPGLCREAGKGGVRLFGSGQNLVATLYIDNLLHALLLAAESPAAASHAYYVTDGEFLDANEFIGMLCQSLGLGPPRRGIYALAYAAAWIRERLALLGPWPAEVARRGRSSLFDIGCAVKDLNYEPKVTVAEGMKRLAEWVAQAGGPAAIARTARVPTSLESVEREAREAAARALEGETEANS